MRLILRPNLWGWFGLNSLWLAAQHGASTRSAGDLDWQCQVVSCNPLAPWVENLWFKDTPGQNYLLYTPICFQKYDICPKILFLWLITFSKVDPTKWRRRSQETRAGCHSAIFLHLLNDYDSGDEKNFYDNDAKNSFDLLFDPGDVVGNVCIYARCWLRRERTVLNENSTPHLVAVVLKESLTDHTGQGVLFTRVQDCQWSTTVPLYQVDFVGSSCS